jgi:signal transduction histidine kinase
VSWAKRRELFKMILILIWLIFTVAFAVWWFTFSVDHISTLAQLQPERLEHWERQKRMVFWEGSTWLVLLALGGAALVGLVQRERLRSRRIREFFASFSHEVKTSLASLRVQAEALQDDLGNQSSPILNRLVGDTVRLQLQLENSLFLASQDDLKLYFESVRLSSLVDRMREQWPNLTIEIKGDGAVRGDVRALRTIFSNLVQNSHVHGKASRISVEVEKTSGGQLRVTVRDDGRGFSGPAAKLGELFHRPENTSGSGLGLHISQMLMRKMGGDIRFDPGSKGFCTILNLEGEAS